MVGGGHLLPAVFGEKDVPPAKTVCAVLTSDCATTVSVCFRCPDRTVGFSGIHLHLCVYNNQAERRSGAAHLLARQAAREDYSLVVTCTKRRSICYRYSRHPLLAQAPLNLV